MERRKNSNLHVVREPEDPTDKIIDEIMDELNSEDGMPEKEVREELMKEKKGTEKDDGWYCDKWLTVGSVDISADQSTDIYQGYGSVIPMLVRVHRTIIMYSFRTVY